MESNLDKKHRKAQQNPELIKSKAVIFFRGCDYRKCASKDCRNFIGEKTLADLRENAAENLPAVLELLAEDELKINCFKKEKVILKLPEVFQRFEYLFAFDINQLLSGTSAERIQYFANLEKEFCQKFINEDADFKLKTLLYFEDFMRDEIDSIVLILSQKIRDFDFFETIVLLFFGFLVVFDFELFVEEFSLQRIYHQLNFNDALPANQEKQILASKIFEFVNRKKISNANEELQNLLTLCYPINEFLMTSGKVRNFSLTVICNSIGFAMAVNSLLSQKSRLPLKEFTNATLSEELSDKDATVGFIMGHPGHPLQTFLNAESLIADNQNMINFMQFPFLLTVDRRVDVLNQESVLFQKTEMLGGFTGNFLQMMMNNTLYLNIQLRRDHILEDALTQLSKTSNRNNLRKQLKISFVGEPGVDEGGVKKEFFSLLTAQLFDPNFGMFIEKNERFLWFNSGSLECNLNFEMVGILLGLALYNEVILSLKFPQAVYKKLIAEGSRKPMISERVGLEDLQEIDPGIYTTLNNLLAKNWTGKETGLLFVVSYEQWGEVKEHELMQDGGSTTVTEENKSCFVELYLDWYFYASIKTQFNAFAVGFFRVFLKDSFTLFNAEDLLLAICGSTVLDFGNLKKTTSYENYTEQSITVVHFWNVLLNDFDEDQQREFLKFLTGSDRAPIRGLGDIKMIVTKTGDSNSLPSAHTCFNHLILPDYRDYEKLKSKLLKAIENSEGFGLF